MILNIFNRNKFLFLWYDRFFCFSEKNENLCDMTLIVIWQLPYVINPQFVCDTHIDPKLNYYLISYQFKY